MNKEQKSFITFGAQIGDMQAERIVGPYLTELARILEKYCYVPYSSDIDEFAPIARVDGDIWYWQFEGCQKLRLSKKGRYITVDIGVPKNRWDGVESFELRQYLISNLKLALELMVKKLEKEKIPVDSKRLFEDMNKIEADFLRNCS